MSYKKIIFEGEEIEFDNSFFYNNHLYHNIQKTDNEYIQKVKDLSNYKCVDNLIKFLSMIGIDLTNFEEVYTIEGMRDEEFAISGWTHLVGKIKKDCKTRFVSDNLIVTFWVSSNLDSPIYNDAIKDSENILELGFYVSNLEIDLI